MVDTSHLDLLGIVHQSGVRLKRVASTNGGEWAGACPLCGGTDRFRVWAHPTNGSPHMWCRQCGFSGDAIAFVMRVYNEDFPAACQRLGIAPSRPAASQVNVSSAAHAHQPPVDGVGDLREYDCFNPAWQAAAGAFADKCAGALWNGWDRLPAARYLRERGIGLEAAMSFMIGYNHESHKATWGDLEVWLPRGITIPWMFEHQYWNVRIRRPQAEVQQGQDKYTSVKGCANGLYNAGMISADSPLIITEGEFDAALLDRLLLNARAYNIAVASIGNVTGARRLRWVTRVALARRVYLAFDADEAGDKAAAWWIAAIGERARRLRPAGGKDITEMWQHDQDVLAWVKAGMLVKEGA